jgi:hypothetical protein
MNSYLVYLVSFDPVGYHGSRTMAKLLVSSLLKTICDCEIIVFRNYPEPLYMVGRDGLEERFVDTPSWQSTCAEDVETCLHEALEWRFKAHRFIDPKEHDYVVYLDCDCLALRNLDHLFAGTSDLIVQREIGRSIQDPVFSGYLSDDEITSLTSDGINAGTIAVRSEIFHEFMSDWEKIFNTRPTQHERFRDQTALNRLIIDGSWSVKSFEKGEITFPFHLNPRYQDYRDSALIHMVGEDQRRKIDLAFALFMASFYNDGSGVYLDFLEI